MKKILLATPVIGGLPPAYVQTLLNMFLKKKPEVQYDYCLIAGTIINMARNEIANYGRVRGCDEIVFWDKDLKPSQEQFERLLSHDEDVVCAAYARRSTKTDFHVCGLPDEFPRKDGLQKVFQSAIGFSKIKVSVFERLAKANPWRRHVKFETGSQEYWLDEFFPMGVAGKNTPEGKIEQIKKLLSASDHEWVHRSINEIIDNNDASDHQILGEDFYFCRLLREAGIPMYLDTHLLIPHSGEVDLPIPTPDVKAMLKEEWRKDV